MERAPHDSPQSAGQCRFAFFLEWVFVFGVFCLYGNWPIPDSNEPYYIGKAIHYWQPDWVPNDSFLESKDAHWFFCGTFGALSFFLDPTEMAWFGRLFCWLFMALGWLRLSRAILPGTGFAIVTASAMLFYLDTFHLAGEWVAGGVEGKTFAFPFVFFGLEAMVRGRWNRCWIFFGIASAFHPLVGGWSVVCGLSAWATSTRSALERSHRPGIFAMVPGLVVGGLLSLPGLLPVWTLNHGIPQDVLDRANEAYVYLRLYHHLLPSALSWTFTARFLLVAALWTALTFLAATQSNHENGNHAKRNQEENERGNRAGEPCSTLARFVFASLLLAGIGLAIDHLLSGNLSGGNRPLAAKLLRFYWFRTSDWAVPTGLAFASTLLLQRGASSLFERFSANPDRVVARLWKTIPVGIGLFALYLGVDYLLFNRLFFSWDVKPDIAVVWGCVLLAFFLAAVGRELFRTRRPGEMRLSLFFILVGMVLIAPGISLLALGDLRMRNRQTYSRIDPGTPYAASRWLQACDWIRANTPREAKFLVPRDAATFKWNARRSDVGVWKEIPQDAPGIDRWRETMEELFAYRDEEGVLRWDRSLPVLLWQKNESEIRALQQKHGFHFILSPASPDLSSKAGLLFKPVYQNEVYAVYEFVAH
ncbi:MAG TPA: hypothetical protein DEB39_08375 [Planctomycetaceae bacterium]|nr:hypothetical protein [Planctomycetaceae bacterium]